MLTLLLWCFTAEVSSFPALFHLLLPSRARVTVGKTDFCPCWCHQSGFCQTLWSLSTRLPQVVHGMQWLWATINGSQFWAQKSLSPAFWPNLLSSGRNLGNKSETVKPCGWYKTKKCLRLLDHWLATAQLWRVGCKRWRFSSMWLKISAVSATWSGARPRRG